MPPNIKFTANLVIGDELIDVVSRNTSGEAAPVPPPLTVNDDGGSGDDTFFLHDVEEAVEPPKIEEGQDTVKKESKQESPKPLTGLEHEHQEQEHHQHHHAARWVIKHLASQIDDPDELDIDNRRLARAVRDAGEFSCGVIACEVWALEDDKLVRLKSGWWHNTKLYQNTDDLEQLASEEAHPVMLGVDLPGILWAETVRDGGSLGASLVSRPSSLFLNQGHSSNDGMIDPSPHGHDQSILRSRTGPSMENSMHLHLPTANPHALLWRDLHSIQDDPDSAKTQRLSKLINAGLCAAAGVPYHVRDHHGLVIYYTRSHTRTKLLSNVANDAYLRASAQMIGHTAAFSEMRRASVESRRRQTMDASDRFKKNLLQFHRERSNGSGHSHSNELLQVPSAPKTTDSWDPEDDKERKGQDDDICIGELSANETHMAKVQHFIRTWCHKCRGGDLQVPPAMTCRQTLWTVFGAFCGLLVLSSLNEYYKILSDDDYFLLIGPFGALMTLQYGLTAAPASQPRNVVLGQAVSGAVSLAFTYIPESVLAIWLRRAVGPAVAIGAMVKFGVTHPPAGAHAVLYASGQYNFGFYALVVLSSAISVVPATIVNNMSTKRQYPTYWTLIPWSRRVEKES